METPSGWAEVQYESHVCEDVLDVIPQMCYRKEPPGHLDTGDNGEQTFC